MCKKCFSEKSPEEMISKIALATWKETLVMALAPVVGKQVTVIFEHDRKVSATSDQLQKVNTEGIKPRGYHLIPWERLVKVTQGEQVLYPLPGEEI